jgi:N-acetylmuramoyl-L-alanine amidase
MPLVPGTARAPPGAWHRRPRTRCLAPERTTDDRYHVLVLSRTTAALLLALALPAISATPHSEAQGQTGGLRILSRDGTRRLNTTTVSGQEYVALDEVAATFGLTVREDRLAGGVTLASGGRSVIITPDQPVVSVAGRLVSLTAAPVRQNNRWLVPLDLLQRAVGPVLDMRVELRRASRLVVVGDLRVPRASARVEPSPGSAAVIFDITPAAPARVTVEGARLVVNFDADALDLNLPTTQSSDYLQSIQPGDTPTSVRIVPGPKFALHRATTSQPEANASRLTIELLPAGAEPPSAPAPVASASAPGGATADKPAAPSDPFPLPTPGVRTIVIDPGHGGEESGTRGPAGTLEKDLTLAVARRLRTMVESRLGLRVFLTRDDDRLIPLDDRSAYANSQRADAFISIHANASLRPSVKGAEVHYLSAPQSDVERQGEGPVIALPTLGGGARVIDVVPWERAQFRHLARSSALAGIVEQALRTRVAMSSRPVQQGPYRVLVGASMPAVLVEVGYLSNPEEEKTLASAATQEQLAQALFDAIVQFRAQSDRATPQAGQR